MGVVKRQGIASGIFMYVGLFLGFISSTILFPRFLGPEVYGFTQWLVYVTSMMMIFANFGLNSTVVRFMPYFKDKEKGNSGILMFILLLITFGSTLASILVIVFEDSVKSIFEKEGSSFYIDSYYFLLPILIFLMSYKTILSSYSDSIKRPRFPVFLSEIVERSFVLLILCFFILKWINVEEFIYLFVFKFALTILGLIWFLLRISEFSVQKRPTFFKKPVFKEMLNYGLYSILSRSGGQLISKIDGLMVAALVSVKGMGIYLPFYFISRIIVMPHNGISKISRPMIATAWKNNNIEKLDEIYKRTAINNLAVGLIIFIGIWSNIGHAVTILGPEYSEGMYVAFYMGLAQIVHILNGYNGLILINSAKYRFDLISKGIAVGLTIVTNYYFITWYGMVGAAMATALTLVVSNFINQSFVYYHFKLHPFTRNTGYLLLIGLATFLAGVFIPSLSSHWYIDFILRSTIICLMYGVPLWVFNLTPDLKSVALQGLRKIGIKS